MPECRRMLFLNWRTTRGVFLYRANGISDYGQFCVLGFPYQFGTAAGIGVPASWNLLALFVRFPRIVPVFL